MGKKWFAVPKYPSYEISDSLDVRRKSTGRIIGCFINDGYLKLNISHLGKRYKPYLHQMVAWTFVPNPENKPEIHHIDCDPLNNHWSNLMWVTKKEHREISKANGQVAFKLSHEDIRAIRGQYSHEKKAELAVKFNVLPSTIYLIATGRKRADVPGGKIHEPLGNTKKIVNIESGQIYESAENLASMCGVNLKTIRRKVNGERYNDTPYRYLGEEHLSRSKPRKVKVIPFVPHVFGVIVSRRELMRSKNPKALWKAVIQYSMDGEPIATHESIRKAALAVGAKDHKRLQKLLNGRKNGKTFKGFIWKHAS